MHSSNKHSTIKGLLLKLGMWSRACMHGHPYKARHKMHGRPDAYKDHGQETIRKPEEEG
jgi:hypothetical protein